ncbi:MAG TPA: ribosome biogenesis GTP-binding protein YihA/YsxC [Bacteroidales bacterium]|nr:ribosome biogenesis GTP-binding protein YihA/YsxC [Bacteroidales bacterium]
MIISEAKFVKSSPDLKNCPKTDIPEFAFIGRSNVGKSSLINMLTSQNNLAKTSSTPGKTRLINFFLINNKWHLVDLPGYGYAKVSKTQRGEFRESIINYIGKRNSLYCVFVLLDSRLEPQEIDIKFIRWLGKNEIPFQLVSTKADKISQAELSKFLKAYREVLKEDWEEIPEVITTSSPKKAGRDEILAIIENAMAVNKS